MNKTKKRQLHIRNKLIAAVAMLLVSSIMMVSTTYAWFTLSTAPEVQGITTTVGANGNLEIALSPESGLGTDVEASAVGDSDKQWVEKNLIWGNLLDMSDTSYGLQNIVLLPSQLVVDSDKLPAAPLAIPIYGPDGRIDELSADTIIGGKTRDAATDTLSSGFSEGGVRGVRAVGTASSMSEQQLAKNTGMAAIKSNQNAAIAAASISLNANGNALANMLVAHARAGEGDSNDYAQYVDELTKLVNDLDASTTAIGESIRGMLLVGASQINDSTQFSTTKQLIENATDMEVLLKDSAVSGYISSEQMTTLLADWRAVKDTVSTAKTAVSNLDATQKVTWAQASPVLTHLMNTDGDITINGYTIENIKAEMGNYNFLLGLARDTKIVLGSGSGVYYDIAEIAGNISAVVNAQVEYNDSLIDLENVSIKTSAPTPAQLDNVYTAANAITPAGGTAVSMIDTYYGYVLDFMFRTNVSGSYLKLQTEGAQRIYSNATNESTMGGGSTITFTTSETVPANIVKGMAESIQLVFFDPDTTEVYGVAKVTGTNNTETAVIGNLELCGFTVDGNNHVSVGNVLTGDTAAKICNLSQNTPKALSVLVMLDGSTLTNADVLNGVNIVGTLNLQFASSATLTPMTNTALMTGSGSTDTGDAGNADDNADAGDTSDTGDGT